MMPTQLKKSLTIQSHRDNFAWKRMIAQAAIDYQSRDRAEGTGR
jgi:hypothetical protein